MEKNICCDRCGRDSHITDECLGRFDVNNRLINDNIKENINEDTYIRFAEPNETLLNKIIQTAKIISSNIKKFLEPPKGFKN
jgi:hypothetical protein